MIHSPDEPILSERISRSHLCQQSVGRWRSVAQERRVQPTADTETRREVMYGGRNEGYVYELKGLRGMRGALAQGAGSRGVLRTLCGDPGGVSESEGSEPAGAQAADCSGDAAICS